MEVERIAREFRRSGEEPVGEVGVGWREVREGREKVGWGNVSVFYPAGVRGSAEWSSR